MEQFQDRDFKKQPLTPEEKKALKEILLHKEVDGLDDVSPAKRLQHKQDGSNRRQADVPENLTAAAHKKELSDILLHSKVEGLDDLDERQENLHKKLRFYNVVFYVPLVMLIVLAFFLLMNKR